MRVMVWVASATAAAASVAAAPAWATVLGNEDPGTRFSPVYATMAEAWTGVAPCLGMRETAAAAAFTGAPMSAKIAGVSLTDTAERLAAFKAISKRSGKAALKRAKDADCADVACAARAMFGDEAAPLIVNLAVRYHYIAADKKTAWGADDLEELTGSLSDLPDSWFTADAKSYRLLVRRSGDAWTPTPIPASLTLVAMAGAGLPGILVQDGWSTLRPNARRAAIVHEMAHELSRNKSGKWKGAWRTAMAADEAAGRTMPVSAYAGTNAEEDFAESVTAYRYMAPALMRRAPARYAFLRDKVFGGLEYGSEAKCRRTYASAGPPLSGR